MNHAADVRETRDNITRLGQERDALELQARSREGVRREVIDQIEAATVNAANLDKRTLGTLARGLPAELLTAYGTAQTESGPIHVRINLLPIALRLLGPVAVKKALLAGLEYVPAGLEPDARAERLAAIGAELDALQTEEERLIREAAVMGEDIARRPDADPHYVLSRD